MIVLIMLFIRRSRSRRDPSDANKGALWCSTPWISLYKISFDHLIGRLRLPSSNKDGVYATFIPLSRSYITLPNLIDMNESTRKRKWKMYIYSWNRVHILLHTCSFLFFPILFSHSIWFYRTSNKIDANSLNIWDQSQDVWCQPSLTWIVSSSGPGLSPQYEWLHLLFHLSFQIAPLPGCRKCMPVGVNIGIVFVTPKFLGNYMLGVYFEEECC